MSDFWWILITGLLVYLVYDREKEKRSEVKEKSSIDDSLLDTVGKYCEISLKIGLVYINGDYEIRGTIKEMDNDWIVIETKKRDKTITRVIRKSLISGIKVIKQK